VHAALRLRAKFNNAQDSAHETAVLYCIFCVNVLANDIQQLFLYCRRQFCPFDLLLQMESFQGADECNSRRSFVTICILSKGLSL